MRDRCLRQDAVAKIENEGLAAKRREHGIDFAIECHTSGQQCQRVEVTLDRPQPLDLITGKVPVDHPVESDRIHRYVLHIAACRNTGAAWEPDDLRPSDLLANPCNNSSRRRDAPA